MFNSYILHLMRRHRVYAIIIFLNIMNLIKTQHLLRNCSSKYLSFLIGIRDIPTDYAVFPHFSIVVNIFLNLLIRNTSSLIL